MSFFLGVHVFLSLRIHWMIRKIYFLLYCYSSRCLSHLKKLSKERRKAVLAMLHGDGRNVTIGSKNCKYIGREWEVEGRIKWKGKRAVSLQTEVRGVVMGYKDQPASRGDEASSPAMRLFDTSSDKRPAYYLSSPTRIAYHRSFEKTPSSEKAKDKPNTYSLLTTTSHQSISPYSIVLRELSVHRSSNVILTFCAHTYMLKSKYVDTFLFKVLEGRNG